MMTKEDRLKQLLYLQQSVTQSHIQYHELQAEIHQAFLKVFSNNASFNQKQASGILNTGIDSDYNPVPEDFKEKFEAHLDCSPNLGSIPSISTPISTPSVSALPSTIGNATISRAVLRPLMTPSLKLPLPGLLQARGIMIVNDKRGVGLELSRLFAEMGLLAVVMDPQQKITEDSIERFKQEKIFENHHFSTIDYLIDLVGIQPIDHIEAAITCNLEAFTTFKAFAQELQKATQNGDGGYVSVQDTGGDFVLRENCGDRVWLAGLAGLAKTVHREYPNLNVRILDVATKNLKPIQIAHKIFNELMTGGSQLEVGLNLNHERIAPVLEYDPDPLALPDFKSALLPHIENHKEAIIVSGGARGVTADCIIALAQEFRAHYVLLGRTVLNDENPIYHNYPTTTLLQKFLFEEAKSRNEAITPKKIRQKVESILAEREIRATLTALISAGASVEYMTLDIQNAIEVDQVLEKVRTAGFTISGIIHGAGVLADKLISEKTLEQFNRVFNTKIKGLQALLNATVTDTLKFVILFSSVAARYGNLGQSDYAMANEILNKVAQQLAKERKHCLVKSINWGPWESGMVTPTLKNKFLERGIHLLPVDLGAKCFVSEIKENTNSVEVIIGSGLNPVDQFQTITPYDYHITVNIKNQPYLLDHAINEVVVIPMCQALEWFVQAGQGVNTDLPYFIVKNIQVLRGITLPEFKKKSDHYKISVTPITQRVDYLVLKMVLIDETGRRRYQATLIKTRSPVFNERYHGSSQSLVNENFLELSFDRAFLLATWDAARSSMSSQEKWNRKNIYQEPDLFHGPGFQVIKELLTLSDQGGSVILKLSPQSNSCTPFITLDACLQVFRLWGFDHFQKLSLPAKIGIYQIYTLTWPEEIRCFFKSENIGHSHAKHSAYLESMEGQPLALLAEVEAFYQWNK